MKKIQVIVKSSAKKSHITKLGQSTYELTTTQPARNNQANLAVIKLLSKYLNVPKSRLIITHGLKSPLKTITILD